MIKRGTRVVAPDGSIGTVELDLLKVFFDDGRRDTIQRKDLAEVEEPLPVGARVRVRTRYGGRVGVLVGHEHDGRVVVALAPDELYTFPLEDVAAVELLSMPNDTGLLAALAAFEVWCHAAALETRRADSTEIHPAERQGIARAYAAFRRELAARVPQEPPPAPAEPPAPPESP